MSTSDRFSRLLALVPYFQAHPGVTVTQAAAELGASPSELRDDLQLLFLCGLPGYGPGDLIDLHISEDDTVFITFDAGMNRPLRLTPSEAIALLVALRALAGVPGLGERDAVTRALAKIAHAAGPQLAEVAQTRVSVRTYANVATMQAVTGALARGHALRITYYSASSDSVSERVVDPVKIVLSHGTAYVWAGCRNQGDMRLFRLDRIETVTELDSPARPAPADAQEPMLDGEFQPDPTWPIITLRVNVAARWITEYYPCEEVLTEAPGSWLVRMRASDLTWARRLVMRLGPDAEIVAPQELASAVAQTARAALAAYE